MNEDDDNAAAEEAEWVSREEAAYYDAMQALAYEFHMLQTCTAYKWMGCDV